MPESISPISRSTFTDLNPSNDSHFDVKDVRKVEAIWSILRPAMQARRPAVENARKTLGIMNDLFVDVMEEKAPIDRETASWEQQQNSQKRLYYNVNMVLSLAALRQANYASTPTEFLAQRLTLCEADRITSEVAAGLVNRFYSPQLERGKKALTTSVCWQGHTMLHIVWDPTLGPSRRPRQVVETTEPTSEYMAKGPTGRRTEKVTVQNKSLGRTKTVPKSGVVAAALRAMGRDETEEVAVYQKMDQWGSLLFNDIPTGLPRVDVVGPVDYVVDPLAREGGMADARFAAVVKRVDAAYLYEQFGDESKYPGAMAKLTAWEKWSSRIDANVADKFVRSKQGAPNESAGEQSGTLTICYLLSASQLGLPHGLYCIIVSEGSPETDDAPGSAMVLYWDELPPPHMIPLIDGAVEIATPSSFYGQTYAQKGAALNHQLNRIYGYIDEAAGLASQRWLAGQAGDAQQSYRTESVGAAGGATVVIPPNGAVPGQAITELRFDGSQMFQMNLVKDIMHTMEDLSHTHGPSANQSDLAVEVMANLQRDESVAGQVKQGIAGQYARGAHYFLRLLQIYATIDDLQRLMPDYVRQDLETFKAADLGEYSTLLRLKQTTMLSNNPALQSEYMKSFAQMGDRIWQVVTPRELASVFLSHSTLGETSSSRQEELAERENSRLRTPVKWKKQPDADGNGGVIADGSGPDPIALVAPSDNDDLHLDIHHNPLDDPRRDLLPVDYLTRLDQHCARHEAQKMAKLMKAAQAAALTQAAVQSTLEQAGVQPPGAQPQQPQGAQSAGRQ
jgi:hypothetical protein